jgi:hypothetical protein
VFRHFGSGFTIFDHLDPGWKYTLQGRPVAEQPDKEYASWIDASYRQALDEAAPRFDHVDAVVRTATGSGHTQTDRFIYDRLMLPSRSAGGERVLLNVSYGEHRRAVDA